MEWQWRKKCSMANSLTWINNVHKKSPLYTLSNYSRNKHRSRLVDRSRNGKKLIKCIILVTIKMWLLTRQQAKGNRTGYEAMWPSNNAEPIGTWKLWNLLSGINRILKTMCALESWHFYDLNWCWFKSKIRKCWLSLLNSYYNTILLQWRNFQRIFFR